METPLNPTSVFTTHVWTTLLKKGEKLLLSHYHKQWVRQKEQQEQGKLSRVLNTHSTWIPWFWNREDNAYTEVTCALTPGVCTSHAWVINRHELWRKWGNGWCVQMWPEPHLKTLHTLQTSTQSPGHKCWLVIWRVVVPQVMFSERKTVNYCMHTNKSCGVPSFEINWIVKKINK